MPFSLRLLLKLESAGLVGKACQYNRSYIKPPVAEYVEQSENIEVVCNAEVASDFVFLNIVGVDYNYNFGFVLELHKHLELGVGFEPGKNTGSVIVVKELSAELEIKLVTELGDSFADML